MPDDVPGVAVTLLLPIKPPPPQDDNTARMKSKARDDSPFFRFFEKKKLNKQIGNKKAYDNENFPGNLSFAVGVFVATFIVTTLVAFPGVAVLGAKEQELVAGFPAHVNEMGLLNVPFVELISNAN